MTRVYATVRQGRKVLKRDYVPLEKLEEKALEQGINPSELMANRALLKEGNSAFLNMILINGEQSRVQLEAVYTVNY